MIDSLHDTLTAEHHAREQLDDIRPEQVVTC